MIASPPVSKGIEAPRESPRPYRPSRETARDLRAALTSAGTPLRASERSWSKCKACRWPCRIEGGTLSTGALLRNPGGVSADAAQDGHLHWRANLLARGGRAGHLAHPRAGSFETTAGKMPSAGSRASTVVASRCANVAGRRGRPSPLQGQKSLDPDRLFAWTPPNPSFTISRGWARPPSRPPASPPRPPPPTRIVGRARRARPSSVRASSCSGTSAAKARARSKRSARTPRRRTNSRSYLAGLCDRMIPRARGPRSSRPWRRAREWTRRPSTTACTPRFAATARAARSRRSRRASFGAAPSTTSSPSARRSTTSSMARRAAVVVQVAPTSARRSTRGAREVLLPLFALFAAERMRAAADRPRRATTRSPAEALGRVESARHVLVGRAHRHGGGGPLRSETPQDAFQSLHRHLPRAQSDRGRGAERPRAAHHRQGAARRAPARARRRGLRPAAREQRPERRRGAAALRPPARRPARRRRVAYLRRAVADARADALVAVPPPVPRHACLAPSAS